MTKAADVTLPKLDKKDIKKELWKMDKQLNELLDNRRGLVKSTEEYKNITKTIKKHVRYLKNKKCEQEARAINNFATRREIEELFRAFKSDNSDFKDLPKRNKCDPALLKKHFQDHFTKKMIEEDPIELTDTPEFLKILNQIESSSINTNPPDENELRNIVSNLKEGKSACDVPIAYIKCSMNSQEFVEELVKLYQTIWESKLIPKEWGHSKLVCLWKGPEKGSASDPTTYRGLQIGSSLCKIMVILLMERLKDWYEHQLLDQQQGFRQARGTTDGIFIVKSVQQITRKMKKNSNLLFVDLSSAFDHVDRNWLFQTLRKRSIYPNLEPVLQLLESLYSHTTSALAETPEDPFELTIGVRQGGPESPMLYNLYMDFVMRIFMESSKNSGIKFLKLRYKIPNLAS